MNEYDDSLKAWDSHSQEFPGYRIRSIIDMIPNEEAEIQSITRTDLPCIQRLMTLGFVEGSTLRYIGSAFGDPIEVCIEGAHISLNADCASHFFITV